MGDLIDLKHYRPKLEATMKKRKPSKPTFVVRQPLFTSSDTLMLSREKIGAMISRHQTEYLFMPVTRDLEPLWELDIEKGWFNSTDPMYTALFMVIRDYPLEFTQLVDGSLVNYQEDYDKILEGFNKIYVRALENKGSGWPKGVLSKDEMLRMTSLFYKLLMTADRTSGVTFDTMGHMCNGWSGEPRLVNLNFKLAGFFSERLKCCNFAGISWEQFVFQALSAYRHERTTWLFNLTGEDLDQSEGQVGHQGFLQILDMMRLLDPNEHQVMVAVSKTDKLGSVLSGLYRLGMYYNTDDFGTQMGLVSNFDSKRMLKSMAKEAQ